MNNDSLIAVVDTETTGLLAGYHQIWEVGLLLPTDEGYTEKTWQLPVDLSSADPIALNIGHFHQRYKTESLTDPAEFCVEFGQLVAGRHLVGNVISFDEERLRSLFMENGFEQMPWHYHIIDIEPMIVGYLTGQELDEHFEIALPWKSDDLSRLIGVNPDDFRRHTAIGDCRWAMAEWDAMQGHDRFQRRRSDQDG